MKTTTPKTPKAEFPKTVTVTGITGITAKIYRTESTKGGKDYVSYVVAYSLLGKRKLQSFADIIDAERAAEDAIHKIANGEQLALELKNGARMEYLRAKEFTDKRGVSLDSACGVWAECLEILNGLGSPVEAARLFVKHNAKKLAQ